MDSFGRVSRFHWALLEGGRFHEGERAEHLVLSFGVSQKQDRNFSRFYGKGSKLKSSGGLWHHLACWSLILGLVAIPPVAPLFFSVV